MTLPAPHPAPRPWRRPLLVALLVLEIMVILRLRDHSGAFRGVEAYERAAARAATASRPILVIALRPHEPASEHFRRTTLVDPGVLNWIDQHAEPVWLRAGRDEELLAQLGVTEFPSLLMPGWYRARSIEGVHSPPELIRALQQEASRGRGELRDPPGQF